MRPIPAIAISSVRVRVLRRSGRDAGSPGGGLMDPARDPPRSRRRRWLRRLRAGGGFLVALALAPSVLLVLIAETKSGRLFGLMAAGLLAVPLAALLAWPPTHSWPRAAAVLAPAV